MTTLERTCFGFVNLKRVVMSRYRDMKWACVNSRAAWIPCASVLNPCSLSFDGSEKRPGEEGEGRREEGENSKEEEKEMEHNVAEY